MLAMAEQTLPVISAGSGSVPAPAAIPTARSVKLPPRAIAATSTASKLAAALGLLGFAAVMLLAVLILIRRRELIRLREQVAQAMALEARQRPLLTADAGAQHAQPRSAPLPSGRPTS
jgi:hypothetical protein